MPQFPPTDRWGLLTPGQRRARLEAAEDMFGLCQWWRGDPRLSAWDEGFLASLVARLRISEGKYKVSEREWTQFWRIRDLMLADPVDSADEDEEELAE